MDPKLTEAIEACRPNHDDLALPEMKAVAQALERDRDLKRFHEQIHSMDARISMAIKTVPIPVGFEERLKDRLKLAENKTPATPDAQFATPAQDAMASLRSRRNWIVLSVVGSALAACLVIAFIWRSVPDRLTVRDLCEMASIDLDVVESKEWQPIEANLDLPPLPNELRDLPTSYQRLGDERSSGAIAFSLGRSKVLFVRKARVVSTLPTSPPLDPISETKGWLYGSWKKGDFVYTLAVRGSVDDYRGLLKPEEPLAMFWDGSRFNRYDRYRLT